MAVLVIGILTLAVGIGIRSWVITIMGLVLMVLGTLIVASYWEA